MYYYFNLILIYVYFNKLKRTLNPVGPSNKKKKRPIKDIETLQPNNETSEAKLPSIETLEPKHEEKVHSDSITTFVYSSVIVIDYLNGPQ